MVGFTSSIAVLVTLAASTVSGAVIQRAAEPQGSRFILKTAPVTGARPTPDGYSRADENAIVAVKDVKKADLPQFFISTDKKLKWNAGNALYEVYLADSLYAGDYAPPSYNSVQLNDEGSSTSGFVIDQNTGVLFLEGDKDFQGFEIYKVEHVSEDDSVGPDMQLVWKPEGAKGYKGDHCHAVNLVAEYV